MLELRRLTRFLACDEEAFAEIMAQKANKDILAEQKRADAELQKSIVRNGTVSKLYEKLSEDNVSGKVADEWFMQLSHKYDVERMELKAKISELRETLSNIGSRRISKDQLPFICPQSFCICCSTPLHSVVGKCINKTKATSIKPSSGGLYIPFRSTSTIKCSGSRSCLKNMTMYHGR